MSIDTLQQTWKAYLDAYGDVAVPERERLLRQSVTEDVVFTNPTGEGKGIYDLVQHIRQFQENSPGAYFKNNQLLTHHGQLLSEWTMYSKGGSEIMTAHTFARINEQGHFTELAGFFKVKSQSSST